MALNAGVGYYLTVATTSAAGYLEYYPAMVRDRCAWAIARSTYIGSLSGFAPWTLAGIALVILIVFYFCIASILLLLVIFSDYRKSSWTSTKMSRFCYCCPNPWGLNPALLNRSAISSKGFLPCCPNPLLGLSPANGPAPPKSPGWSYYLLLARSEST